MKQNEDICEFKILLSIHELMKTFSIKELEKLTGIKAHTLRIWESRHSILKPIRTSGNNRVYSTSDLRKILDIALLNRNGFKVSHLANLTEKELDQAIIDLEADPVLKEKAVNDLIISMHQMDTERFEKILGGSLSVWTIDTLLNDIVYNFLQKTGLMWKGNRLTEEHFVVTSLRNKIIRGIESAGNEDKKNKKILMFLPSAGQFDLMMLYTNFVLKSKGFHVWYMGSDVSMDNLRSVFREKNPDFVFTYLPKKTEIDISELASIMDHHLPASKLVIAMDPKSQQVNTEYKNVIPLVYGEALHYICEA